MKWKFFIVLCLISFQAFAHIDYKIEISGDEEELLSSLKNASQLFNQSEHKIKSLGTLKRYSEADVAHFIKILHSRAYYDAKVTYTLDSHKDLVHFCVDKGPIYPLEDFQLIAVGNNEGYDLKNITLESIGIHLGDPAHAKSILDAEEALLLLLAQNGYPQATIKKREVQVHQDSTSVTVSLEVDSGISTKFGTTKILGNHSVKDAFFDHKVTWKEGEAFNLKEIQATQDAIEASGLFSSTQVCYGELDSETGKLSMEIHVSEAKHRTIATGLSFTTQRGPGMMAEWNHRNIRGMGERMSFRTNIWKDTQDGKFSYVLPHFGKENRNLLLLAEIEHEALKAYTETSGSLSAIMEENVSSQFRFSYGGKYKSILTEHSDNNGCFHLLSTPLQFHWTATNDLLDPTMGYRSHLKIAPTLQLKGPIYAYFPTLYTGSCYQPLTENHSIVLAAKATIGSIFGTARHAIPPSERFYAGSENTLRGYRYLSVSPLNADNKPIGGRSIMVFNFETRIRATEKLGAVAFYDIGNVYGSSFPQLTGKQLQSIGMGLRYHTAAGPIRFDVAIPLNRRKGLDGHYQIYMSIGQSF